MGFDPIVGVTAPENLASQNVLTKIGLKPEGRQVHYGLMLPFFALRRSDHVGGD